MPILIRIILQRLLVLVFSSLAFFGVNPDLSVPSQKAIDQRKEEQQVRVEDVLQIKEDTSTPTPSKEKIKNVEEKITEIQKDFSNNITQPVINTAKEIISPTLVYNEKNPTFTVRDVVVNILCLEKTRTYTRLSSGSGVIISPSGVVLTNAHVTYPFLKTAQFGASTYSCSIRRENIPNFGYNAELVYYPSDWLSVNREIIKEAAPVGTGENDYALLQITTPLGPTPKTSTFPYASIEINLADLKTHLPITVAGYPSSNSGVFEVDAKPGLKIAESSIVDFFTFNTRSFDVLQTGVNEVAHRGASGGGIFEGNLLFGIVVTTNSNTQGSYINALTIPYIKQDFKKDTQFDFQEYAASPFDTLKARFDSKYKNKLIQIISEN